jgi:hypothetical protein
MISSGLNQVAGQDAKNIKSASGSALTVAMRVQREDCSTLLGQSYSTSTQSGDASAMSVVLPTTDIASGSCDKQISTVLYGADANPYKWQADASCMPATEAVIGNVGSMTVEGQTVTNLAQPIEINLSYNASLVASSTNKTLSCRWFDDNTSSWLNSGCFVSQATSTTITCKCFHLTSFSAYSSDPISSTSTVVDPTSQSDTLAEIETEYLIPAAIFMGIVLLLLIVLAMLISRHRKHTRDKVTEKKYGVTDQVDNSESSKSTDKVNIHSIVAEEEAKAKQRQDEYRNPTLREYMIREHSFMGIFKAEVDHSYGPIQRLFTFLCQFSGGMFAAALWYQHAQQSAAVTVVAVCLSMITAAPLYKLNKFLFTKVAQITESVTELQPHVKKEFESRLKLTVFCLYALNTQMIVFFTYSIILLVLHFEPAESEGFFLSVAFYWFFSAGIFEPIILMAYWHYEIKYKSEQDKVQDDTADILNEEEFQSQIDRSAALDNMPLPEPDFSQDDQAPVVHRPDTPLRAQTPFRPQTPAADFAASTRPTALPAPERPPPTQLPRLDLSQQERPRPRAQPQAHSSVEEDLFSPQPQTPPKAAVAMAEIQRLRQELARAKARNSQGTLGSELTRLAPLRPAGRMQAAVSRLEGLDADRRRYPGREALVRGMNLAPFARNTTTDGSNERPPPAFGLPLLGSARSPPGGQLPELAPLGSRSGSEASGSPRGLSALPEASARRFSRGSSERSSNT